MIKLANSTLKTKIKVCHIYAKKYLNPQYILKLIGYVAAPMGQNGREEEGEEGKFV